MKELPYIKSAAPAIEAWSFMSVSDSLICIDDLERKGSSLELKDVLGLISLLKEQKKCKVKEIRAHSECLGTKSR